MKDVYFVLVLLVTLTSIEMLIRRSKLILRAKNMLLFSFVWSLVTIFILKALKFVFLSEAVRLEEIPAFIFVSLLLSFIFLFAWKRSQKIERKKDGLGLR